jgi:hypothetical protein
VFGLGLTSWVACVTLGARTGLDPICDSIEPDGGCAPTGASGAAGPTGSGGNGFGGTSTFPSGGGTAGTSSGGFGEFPSGGFGAVAASPNGGFGNFGNAPSGGFGGVIGAGGFGGFGGAPTGCAGVDLTPDELPVNLMFLVDQSAAMGCTVTGTGESAWSIVTGAIEDFAKGELSTNVSVAIELFGRTVADSGTLGPSCSPEDYFSPDLDFQSVSAFFSTLSDTIVGHPPSGEAPLQPALTGTVSYVTKVHAVGLDQTAIVVMTGTEPKTCTNVPGLESAASVAYTLGVPIYVIAIEVPANDSCDPSSVEPLPQDLDALAKAGASQSPYVIDSSIDPRTGTLADIQAVQQLLQPAVPCQYHVPAIVASQLPQIAGFEYDDQDGRHLVSEVQSGQCDPMLGGFYFDDPTAPQVATLCPATCNQLTPASFVSLQFGCTE